MPDTGYRGAGSPTVAGSASTKNGRNTARVTKKMAGMKTVKPWHEMSLEERLESKLSAAEQLKKNTPAQKRLLDECETLKRIIGSNHKK